MIPSCLCFFYCLWRRIDELNDFPSQFLKQQARLKRRAEANGGGPPSAPTSPPATDENALPVLVQVKPAQSASPSPSEPFIVAPTTAAPLASTTTPNMESMSPFSMPSKAAAPSSASVRIDASASRSIAAYDAPPMSPAPRTTSHLHPAPVTPSVSYDAPAASSHTASLASFSSSVSSSAPKADAELIAALTSPRASATVVRPSADASPGDAALAADLQHALHMSHSHLNALTRSLSALTASPMEARSVSPKGDDTPLPTESAPSASLLESVRASTVALGSSGQLPLLGQVLQQFEAAIAESRQVGLMMQRFVPRVHQLMDDKRQLSGNIKALRDQAKRLEEALSRGKGEREVLERHLRNARSQIDAWEQRGIESARTGDELAAKLGIFERENTLLKARIAEVASNVLASDSAAAMLPGEEMSAPDQLDMVRDMLRRCQQALEQQNASHAAERERLEQRLKELEAFGDHEATLAVQWRTRAEAAEQALAAASSSTSSSAAAAAAESEDVLQLREELAAALRQRDDATTRLRREEERSRDVIRECAREVETARAEADALRADLQRQLASERDVTRAASAAALRQSLSRDVSVEVGEEVASVAASASSSMMLVSEEEVAAAEKQSPHASKIMHRLSAQSTGLRQELRRVRGELMAAQESIARYVVEGEGIVVGFGWDREGDVGASVVCALGLGSLGTCGLMSSYCFWAFRAFRMLSVCFPYAFVMLLHAFLPFPAPSIAFFVTVSCFFSLPCAYLHFVFP